MSEVDDLAVRLATLAARSDENTIRLLVDVIGTMARLEGSNLALREIVSELANRGDAH